MTPSAYLNSRQFVQFASKPSRLRVKFVSLFGKLFGLFFHPFFQRFFLGTNWISIPGSTTNTQFVAPLVPENPSVFYRLIYQ
ncbi:MAG TPA: hypothetical protein DCQ92_06430 [Verrucomicrobia subdivision 3 bacterium]|nr:hypothetical protein [Limisphaerales bacterium]